LYGLNNKNYVVKNVLKPFFNKEKEVFSALVAFVKKAILKADVTIESCIIFGSVAQKKETAKSDVDLLIVICNQKDKDKIERRLNDIAPAIAQNLQTAISPYILSIAQVRKKYKEKSPVINEILKSNILIKGKSIERMII